MWVGPLTLRCLKNTNAPGARCRLCGAAAPAVRGVAATAIATAISPCVSAWKKSWGKATNLATYGGLESKAAPNMGLLTMF